MNEDDDDRWLEIAGRILDGHPVAWDSVPGDRPPEDPSADALRVIAEVAELHRAPAGEPVHRWGTLAIQEQIGHGTFGDVYRARDVALDRDVALKLVEYTPSATAPDEGRLLARVRHSNVVTVHGAAIHDGRYGIWMEFIRGRTLAAIVREHGPLAPDEVTAIGIDVCRALTAVHESGLLHGDIKPQNVMREDGGRIVVMDFGTGRVVTEGTGGDRLAGTPLYLAPEVLSGAPPDVRADVYSAGVLLYYLFTGAHPVEGNTLDEIRAAHASGARTPVRSRRPEIPRPLASIVERAIAVEPSDRFESAAELERALRESSAKPSRALSKRLVALIGVSVLISVLIGGGRKLILGTAAGPKVRIDDPRMVASALYNESYDLGLKGDWKTALVLVNRAIAENDTSAIAHMWKAWCLRKTTSHGRKEVFEVFDEARRAVEMSSTSPWERLWIEASLDDLSDPDKEVVALTQMARLSPDRLWAIINLADNLYALGMNKPLPYYLEVADYRSIDSSSFDAPFAIRAATALLRAGQTERAVRHARRAELAISNRLIFRQEGWWWPSGASSAWILPVEALWRGGDVPGAAAELDRARTQCAVLPEPARTELAASLVTVNLSLGRSGAAHAVADLMTRSKDRYINHAITAFHAGRRQSSKHELSLVTEAGGAESLPVYLIQAGRLHEAQEYLDSIRWVPGPFPDSLPFDDWRLGPDPGAMQVEQGLLALAKGERQQAMVLLRSARPLEKHPQSIYRFEYLADMYVQQRDWARAIATLEDSLHHRWAPFQALWWMRNELRLAELYHMTGRDADARPLEAHLDGLLVAADSDFPLLVRLRALERKTQTSRAGNPGE